MSTIEQHGGRVARGRRRGVSFLGLLLGLGVLSALTLGWWVTSSRRTVDASIDVDRIVRVERRDLLDAVNSNGRVEPLARVAVMSRASGIVKQLYVEEGDVVTKGQILAELDREQLEAQRAQDVAKLKSAEARLAGAKARVAEAKVRLEDPEVEFLEREADRLERLFQGGNISPNERDRAAREAAASRFRVAQVQASLPVLEASISEAMANFDSAQAELERSETTLREATIRSPIDGVVLLRSREVGDGVSSILTAGGNATQIMTLGDLSEMHIEARVDEVDLGRISEKMQAVVTIDAHRGRVLEGMVERIAPAGSVDNNGIVTFEVRIAVRDPEGLLRPDMTADAKLVLNRRDGALTLPQRSFKRVKGGKWTVARIVGEGEEMSVETREVKLGLSDGLQTEVVEGLSDGDRVLLSEAPPKRRSWP